MYIESNIKIPGMWCARTWHPYQGWVCVEGKKSDSVLSLENMLAEEYGPNFGELKYIPWNYTVIIRWVYSDGTPVEEYGVNNKATLRFHLWRDFQKWWKSQTGLMGDEIVHEYQIVVSPHLDAVKTANWNRRIPYHLGKRPSEKRSGTYLEYVVTINNKNKKS